MIYKIHQDSSNAGKHRNLVECEVLNDWGAANQFRNKFQGELLRAGLHLKVPANKGTNIDDEDDDDDENTDTESYFNAFNQLGDGDAIDLDQG
jgi:hypothetical protein